MDNIFREISEDKPELCWEQLLKSDVKSHLRNLKSANQQEFDEDAKLLCDKLCNWLKSERFPTKALFAAFAYDIVLFSKESVTKEENRPCYNLKYFPTPMKSRVLESVESLEQAVSDTVVLIVNRFYGDSDSNDLDNSFFKNREYFRGFFDNLVTKVFSESKGNPTSMLSIFGLVLFCSYKLGLPVLVFKNNKSPAWNEMFMIVMNNKSSQREFLHSIARCLRKWGPFYIPQDVLFWVALCI